MLLWKKKKGKEEVDDEKKQYEAFSKSMENEIEKYPELQDMRHLELVKRLITYSKIIRLLIFAFT